MNDTSEREWRMDDEGGILFVPGKPALKAKAETPLFMAAARECNEALGIKQGKYLYSEPHLYTISGTISQTWEF